MAAPIVRETVPIADLGGIVVRGVALTNSHCWDSLDRGDAAAFARQAELGMVPR